jgi:hypothetical protein
MDVCKIGNRSYDVHVTAIEENFNILYSDKTGRTIEIGAPMTLDPLGTFIGHKVTLKPKVGHEEDFDELFDYILIPRFDGIRVRMVHNQDSIDYEAYISNGTRNVKRINKAENKVYWGSLELNIVPIRAQVTPYD